MRLSMGRLIKRGLKSVFYSLFGAAVVLVVVFVLYLNNRADLHVWHLADLDNEFRADSDIQTLKAYLELEERLFDQLDEQVYQKLLPEHRRTINRFNRGGLSDPGRQPRNWNRSFELPVDSPQAGVLLLHGMSDSPYSLRHLGEQLHKSGAHVIGLRLPGHGTAPSGLVEITWKDMAAAVRLAVDHLAQATAGKPLYLVGYSNGAALAVHYALATLEDSSLPEVDRLVMISPAIGVSPAAALAVWQARVGHLLGFDKLAWNSILPEYDPYKYGSFAVNAGDVVYRLTLQIQQDLTSLEGTGKLSGFPPTLAFSSVVDATVSARALVDGFFSRLPNGGHELVLFDINRMAEIEPILRPNPGSVIQGLVNSADRDFTLSVITNESDSSSQVVVHRRDGEQASAEKIELELSWPIDIYSLSHVALPFPENDPVYGGNPDNAFDVIHLGGIALRGERGVLDIPASDMLRLRWNPFYPYLAERMSSFFSLDTLER